MEAWAPRVITLAIEELMTKDFLLRYPVARDSNGPATDTLGTVREILLQVDDFPEKWR